MNLFQLVTRIIKRKKVDEVDPHEVLLDAYNLPAYNRHQLEGRMESPLSHVIPVLLILFFVFTAGALLARLAFLQVVQGAYYAEQSSRNSLSHSILFAERGIVRDRRGEPLVWNEPVPGEPYTARSYAEYRGLSHVVGYVRLPRRDSAGFFHRLNSEGVSGVEAAYDELLTGTNGLAIIETDALGRRVSSHATKAALDGDSITLTIDARIQDKLYELMEERVREGGFESGTTIIMDIHSGDLLALVSYPEFDPAVMTFATSSAAIRNLQDDPRNVFLNRAVSGLYTPGSIIKPIVAIAALQEGIIPPERHILSTGALVVPNPYSPSNPSIFRDWRAHGMVDMRRALAVSSNVYFFHIGGGFQEQEGLGITRLERYLRMYGLGEETGVVFSSDREGVVPNPGWKLEQFDDEWRLGDTYNTSIGQYAMQVTPLQAVRATAAIANRGWLVAPRISDVTPVVRERIPVHDEHYTVIHEGLRQAVTEGTAAGVSFPWLSVAAKTGTAEVGARKELINSWLIGFFPYEEPQYAFVTLLERAPAGTLQGSPFLMHHFFQWLRNEGSEYLEP